MDYMQVGRPNKGVTHPAVTRRTALHPLTLVRRTHHCRLDHQTVAREERQVTDPPQVVERVDRNPPLNRMESNLLTLHRQMATLQTDRARIYTY